MKRLLLILALIVAIAVEADAQSIRLGDRIPDTQLSKEMEAPREYACLAFINTDSAPCLTAIEGLCHTLATFSDSMALIFVCNQMSGCEEAIAHLVEEVPHTMVHDSDARIFKAFGIEYVPYTVIYSTKRNRVEWFGTVRQLTNDTIERIINKKG